MMQGPMPQQGGAPMQPPSQPPKPTKEAVFALLENPIQRRFKIDIENDSTIAGDESQEKQDRTQLVEGITKFIEAWGPMGMQSPPLIPLGGKLLSFAIQPFRPGRELEEAIDTAMEKLEASPPQPQGQGKQAEEQVKLQATQAKAKAEVTKAQIDGQVSQQTGQAKIAQIQTEAQAKQQELALKVQVEQQRHQMKMQELQMEHEKAMAKAAMDHQAREHAVQTAKATAAIVPAAKPGGAQQAAKPAWPVDKSDKPGF